MHREARLLLSHDYERHALAWRIAEMLSAGPNEEKPLDIRTQHGTIPGWDDIVEHQWNPSGNPFEVRWQVKHQQSPLEPDRLDKLLHAMCDHNFEARILAPGSFDVVSIAPIRALKTLLDRYRRAAPRHPKGLDGLTADEGKWIDHIHRELGEAHLADVLQRLQIRYAGDIEDLAQRAQVALRSLYSNPRAAHEALLSYVAEHRDPNTVFEADAILTGPLDSLAARSPKKWRGAAAGIHSIVEASRDRHNEEERIHLMVTHNGQNISDDKAFELITSHKCSVITGESGAGKTLLIQHLAARALQSQKYLPIIAHALRGSGLSSWLDGAANILGAPDLAELAEAAKSANHQPIVFLDGFDKVENEYSVARDAATLAHIQSIILVIASRYPILNDACRIELPPPSEEEKQQLWHYWTGERAVDLQLIKALRYPLDVKLAAEAKISRSDPTRYHLVESVIEGRGVPADDRKKLQMCAEFMANKYSPYIRATELRRRGWLPVTTTGFLRVVDGWAHFAHDVFQTFFLSEHLSRAYPDPAELAGVLASQRYDGVLEHLLGADLDEDTTSVLLNSVQNTKLVQEALDGVLGRRVAEISRRQFSNIFEMASDEISRIERHLLAGGGLQDFPIVSPFARCLARLRVERGGGAPSMATEIAQLVRLLDAVILNSGSVRDLRDVYILGFHRFLTCIFCRTALGTDTRLSPLHDVLDVFAELPRSPGLVFVVLKSVGFGQPPAWILDVIKDAWNPRFGGFAKMEALQCVIRVHRFLPEPDRDKLCRFLLALPPPRDIFLSTMHFQTLVDIGAMEAPQTHTIEQAETELRRLLGDPEPNNGPETAANMWRMRLEISGGNLCTAINSLSPDDHLEFLILAALGIVPEHADFSEIILLGELVKADDQRTAPALETWATPPPPRLPVVEECWIIATVGLRKLGLPLPAARDSSPASAAWIAFGACIGGLGIESPDTLLDKLLGIDPVVALSEFIRLFARLRMCVLLGEFGSLSADSLVTGQEERLSRLVCRALSNGFAESEYFESAFNHGNLLLVMEAAATRQVVVWLIRLTNHPHFGEQFAALVHKLQKSSPKLFME